MLRKKLDRILAFVALVSVALWLHLKSTGHPHASDWIGGVAIGLALCFLLFVVPDWE